MSVLSPTRCACTHTVLAGVCLSALLHTRRRMWRGRKTRWSPKDHSRCSPMTWRSTPGITPYRQPPKVICCVLLSHKYNFQRAGVRPAHLMSTHLRCVLRTASASVFPTLIRCLIQSPRRSNRRTPALTHLSVTFHEAGHRGVEQSAGRPRVPFLPAASPPAPRRPHRLPAALFWIILPTSFPLCLSSLHQKQMSCMSVCCFAFFFFPFKPRSYGIHQAPSPY